MRSWLLLCLRFIAAQDYVCSLTDFNRFVGNVQLKVEAHYARVTTSCSQLSDALLYSSEHPEYFPGVYKVKDLTRCPQEGFADQWSLKGSNRLLGVLVMNRTAQDIDFDWEWIESELAFVTPVTNFLPTILRHIPDAINVYVAGAVSNCSSFYFYPGGDVCGYIPMMDICEYFNQRYNMFSMQDDIQADYEAGGHWSDPYGNTRGDVTITYSVPVRDSNGTIRGQLALGMSNKGVSALMEQAKPSANGYVCIITDEGNVVYAHQGAIDILFGKEANMSLAKAVVTWNGFIPVHNATSITNSSTPFSRLPRLFATKNVDTGSGNLSRITNSNVILDGYYVTWTRFEQTLKTWLLVGLIPVDDIDYAAVWSVSPQAVQVTLTDLNPYVKFNISITNNGTLPFNFNVGNTSRSRGLTVTSNSSLRQRWLSAKQTKQVDFEIEFDPVPSDVDSFTTNFVVPIYSVPLEYGPCFKPISAQLVVHVIREPKYVPAPWASTVIYLLTGLTAALVLIACLVLFLYRYSAPVLALAPRLCSIKLVALLFVLGAVAANIAPPTPRLCETTKWLLHLGFTMCVSAIAAKNYRNRRIFTSKKLQVVALSDYQLLVFIMAVTMLDFILLLIGTLVEPYHVYVDGQCTIDGWVTYGFLVGTKVLLWAAAFWNTLRIENIPSAFADSRLNGVFLIIGLMAIIRMGLQFSNALEEYPGIEVFIGCLFIWFGVFLVWAHIVLKLSSGYVKNVRPRSSTKHGSISLSVSRQGLEDRLEALLGEIEAQSTRLLNDKNRAIENVKANEKLMFEVRAELLAITTQVHLADDELERCLPTSIRSAFEKYGPAVNRRMEMGRAAKTAGKTKEGEKPDELNQLLGAESPVSSSPAFSPPSITTDQQQIVAFTPLSVTNNLAQRQRADSDATNPRVHFSQQLDSKNFKKAEEEDMQVEHDPDGDPLTHDEDAPLHKEER